MFYILIIWFGTLDQQVFDTQRFDNRAQCVAARAAIIEEYDNWLTPLRGDALRCIEVNTLG